LAVVSHSPSEFVVDFGSFMPGMEQPHVVSRVVMSPEHAKRLLLTLQDNITTYETSIARIELQTGMVGDPAEEEPTSFS
jgi:hypothetical protein